MIGQGILKQDDRTAACSLGAKGKACWKARRSASRPRSLRPSRASGTGRLRSGLFEELRKLRGELAKAADVPPYVVFSDRTLQEMARLLPKRRRTCSESPGSASESWRSTASSSCP